MHCFFASIYGKWFPWEFTDGHMRSRGETSMFGSLGMCCSIWYRFMGPSILKKYSISPVSILNRVAILMLFALKRVRIEEFQQHSPNQTSFKSSPLEKFCPLYITITRQNWLHQFFPG